MTGYQASTNPDRGFMGAVFGLQDSSNFIVAHWKYAGVNNVDSVPDSVGFYGAPLGVTSVLLGVSNVFYSTAGLVVKRFDSLSLSSSSSSLSSSLLSSSSSPLSLPSSSSA
jgi:hypothetical protein